MIILGLGSNMGDRLANLRKAVMRIRQINGFQIEQISPVYMSDAMLPENAPADWDMPYLNFAMRCNCQLEPLDLLKELKNIEWSIGRKPEIRHWGPRVLDIDILAWDDRIIESDPLTVPHSSLQDRPFALWPLADVAPFWKFPLVGINQNKSAAELVEKWGSRFDGQAPFATKQIYQRIEAPQLVGVINVTPDSFSDGGKFFAADAALKQAFQLIESGAEILDIGAESTAPNATAIDATIEWQRLEPILSIVRDAKSRFLLPPKISVDTRHAEVASKALQFGVDWINDVTGLHDPAMREIVAQGSADCIVMHHVSIPASRHHIIPRDQPIIATVLNWAEKHFADLEKSGIARERIIFDPGIGFGKVPEQSLALIQHIAEFKKLDTRILVGHSRKSFFSTMTAYPVAERDVETLAMSLFLANQPVDYLRLHDIEINARGLKVWRALRHF